MTTPADALRQIADHLERHTSRHGVVTVAISGGDPADNLAVVLDGADPSDITVVNEGVMWPTIRRDYGLAHLVTHVPRGVISEARTATIDQVLTASELVARHNQQQLDVEVGE